MAANTLGQKATEAYTAAAALANPFTRRIAEAIANATNNNNKDAKASGGRGGRGGGGRNNSNKSDNNNDDDTRCSSQDVPFGFLDNMCGPMLRNFNSDLGGGDSGDVDDLTINERDERDRSSRGRSGGGGGGRGRDRGRSGGGRRPTSSYDYDDETMATDITGSYDEDDDTYDDDRRKSSSNRRGRDRKPRTPACDSPSEMSGAYSEFDDTTLGDAESSAYNYETNNKKDLADASVVMNPTTPAEDLLITSSNLLADLSSFLPPTRLPPEVTTRYLSPTILSLADDPNFRVRRAATQALPRMLGSATLDDVKRRLLPKFVALSGDEMYRVRKASGECLVDVSRALSVLPWRIHFGDVWIDDDDKKKKKDKNNSDHEMMMSEVVGGGEQQQQQRTMMFYKPRTKKQIAALHNTIRECNEIRRRALCAIAKKLLEDTNKFVRYGMMQFLGPLIASFYPLDRGSMIGGMGGLLYSHPPSSSEKEDGSGSSKKSKGKDGKLGMVGIGVESVDIAKSSTGLERVTLPSERATTLPIIGGELYTIENILSYNHSLHGLELILHGESSLNNGILPYGGGCNANKDPFGTMGPQFFPHANGMVGRSSALDDDDTDSFLVKAYLKKCNPNGPMLDSSETAPISSSSPRSLLPKFLLESRSDALALTRIVWHRTGRVPTDASSMTLPYPPLMSGKPDPEDLKLISNTLLMPFIAMASCQTGEETTDAEMRVYCAYSLPAVILLFGGGNWEKDGLKRCFLDLIGRANMDGDDGNGDGGAVLWLHQHHKIINITYADNTATGGGPNTNNSPGPPLPVKRCLASSVHALAHMLGPDIVSKDAAFLAAFEKSFLRDPDEAIRLNILKNLASFLGACKFERVLFVVLI